MPIFDIANGIAKQPAPTTIILLVIFRHLQCNILTGVDQVYYAADPTGLAHVSPIFAVSPASVRSFH